MNLGIRQVGPQDFPDSHPNLRSLHKLLATDGPTENQLQYPGIESKLSSAVRRILWWVFTGNRGGANRARIIISIKEKPLNANQLSRMLGMDYKTVRHHLTVLMKNHLILEVGQGYGSMYFPSPELEQEYAEFMKIWERIGSK